MAWTWLSVAAKTIPWSTLIRRAPEIIEASTMLLARRKGDQAAKRSAAETESQIDALRDRLDTLEIHDQENAKLVEQIAEQLQDLTNGVEVVAARVRLLLVVLVVTLALGVIGFFAVLR
jgi:hypothetical protein